MDKDQIEVTHFKLWIWLIPMKIIINLGKSSSLVSQSLIGV